MPFEDGLATVPPQMIRKIGIVEDRAQVAPHLRAIPGDEVVVARAEQALAVVRGALTSGMPLASASNTRMVGMPCNCSTYGRRGT